MSELQVVDRLGEESGLSVRTLDGNRIINPYFGSCTVQSSSIAEGALVISQQCSAEGEAYSVIDLWEIETATSFSDQGTLFSLCEGTSNSTSQSDSSPNQTVYDADVIYSAQVSLTRLGLNPGPIDGQMGPRTRQAMNDFQRQNGLPRTQAFNDETLDLLIQSEMALYEDAAQDFETQVSNDDAQGQVEPSSGGRLTEGTANELPELTFSINLLEQIAATRQTLASQPSIFIEHLSDKLHPDLIEALDASNPFERVLKTAGAFVGCLDTDQHVIGFYNVVQNIWVIVWLGPNNNVVHLRTALGFVRTGATDENAWFDFYQEGRAITESLREAYQTQADIFSTVFNGETCDAARDENAHIFNINAAVGTAFENDKTALSLPSDIFVGLEQRIAHREGITQIDNVRQAFVLESSDENDFDYLTFHTITEDRLFYLIQAWRINDGNMLGLGRRWIDLSSETE